VRRAVFTRDGYRCRSCGRAGRLECDHRVPLWKDPSQDFYALDNLQSLCRGCHMRKSADERKRQPSPEESAWRELVADVLVSTP